MNNKKIIVYVDDEIKSIQAFNKSFATEIKSDRFKNLENNYEISFLYFQCVFDKNNNIVKFKKCSFRDDFSLSESAEMLNSKDNIDCARVLIDATKGILKDYDGKDILFVIDLGLKGEEPVDEFTGMKLLEDLKKSKISPIKQSKYAFLTKNNVAINSELSEKIAGLEVKKIKKPDITNDGFFRDDCEGVVYDEDINGELDNKTIKEYLIDLLSKMDECSIMVGLILWELLRN